MEPTGLVKSYTLPDLTIPECIPNCNECSRIWINECIGHRIVCKCKWCSHGNQNSDKSGQMSGMTSESTDTTPGSNIGVMLHG
jgi:hypothetical protein